jgi:hemolysin activation/secretion protein
VSQETQNVSNPILLLPSIAVRLERRQEISTLFVDLGFEANVLPIDDAQNLGRGGADSTWQLLLWNAIASHYLEPLLFPTAWRDTSTPASSTLAHELYFSTRGQYAFGHRLISQATQVIGGLYSVRGYPQSAAIGDDVVIGTLEYRLHLPNILPIRHNPIQLPWLGPFRWTRQQPYGRADWDLVLRLFVDTGYTRQSFSSSALAAVEPNQFLAGAGIGAELSIRSYLRARVDYGWALLDSKATDPLERVSAGSNQIYFYFNLSF